MMDNSSRGWSRAIAVGISALLSSWTITAMATTWGGVIDGVRPDDKVLIRLDGRGITLRADGGWAAVGETEDGGFRLYPVAEPDGYFWPEPDGGWSSVRKLPDGGHVRTQGEKPPGYQ